jgi:hypothetical protein
MTNDLITRLEGLTEPSHSVDRAIWRRFSTASSSHAYTASVDAVLELIERELPDRSYDIVRHPAPAWLREENPKATSWFAVRLDPASFPGSYLTADHPLPAVALLIAFLRAKETHHE